MFKIILGFILSLFLLIFIFQNSSQVKVHFIIWHFYGSLALILILTFIIAVMICMLVAIPYLIKRNRKKEIKIENIELTEKKEAI